jgi:hypothetical protein
MLHEIKFGLDISSILKIFQKKVAFKAIIANFIYTCKRIAFIRSNE